jgi:hypothetical protein
MRALRMAGLVIGGACMYAPFQGFVCGGNSFPAVG